MNFGALRSCSLDSFPLKWRWTSDDHAQFASEALASIRPLERSDAGQIWRNYVDFFDSEGMLKPDRFAAIETLDSKDARLVNELLEKAASSSGGRLVLSWEPELAVVLPFKLFQLHWEDFCYPSSDDVAVIPESNQWLLAFHHWEQFELGRSPAA